MTQTYPLYTQEQYQYQQTMLAQLTNLLYHYTHKHSKALVVRFDVHFPSGYPATADNYHISDALAYLMKKYKRQGLDPKYFWVREQDSSVHHHYHVVLFLDGQKVCSYKHVFQNMEEIWGRILDYDVNGCIHHCNKNHDGSTDMGRNGLQIRRCDGQEIMHQQMQAVYNQISYLAKMDTKVFNNNGIRNFAMSRIAR